MMQRPALFFFAFALALCVTAHAERADRDKPIHIVSDRMNANDATKTAVFEGKVVLTQGTLTIHADRLTVHQDSEGFESAVALGKPATFRQKGEGSNGYIEGQAQRIEYDGRTDRVQLFKSAHIRRDNGDDVQGGYISYDAKTEYFTVQSAPGAATQGGDNRVRAVIMPKNKTVSGTQGARAAPADRGPAPAGASPRPQ